jgi:hypothetical protein
MSALGFLRNWTVLPLATPQGEELVRWRESQSSDSSVGPEPETSERRAPGKRLFASWGGGSVPWWHRNSALRIFQKTRSPTHGLLAIQERATPRARSQDLAGRHPFPLQGGCTPNSASAVSSCPSDLAAAENDASAPTVPAPGGEGEPHSQSRDALLGSTDKELKAGAAVTANSAPTALGGPWQRKPQDKAMEAGLWGGPTGKGC